MTMNAQKFTQKSLEAIGLAQDTAIEYQNMQEMNTQEVERIWKLIKDEIDYQIIVGYLYQ